MKQRAGILAMLQRERASALGAADAAAAAVVVAIVGGGIAGTTQTGQVRSRIYMYGVSRGL